MNARPIRRAVTAALLCGTLLWAASAAAADPGDLDGAWNTTGQVTTPFGTNAADANAVALDPVSGQLVVAGPVAVSGTNQFGLVRYNADGSVDPSFGGGAFSMPILGGANPGDTPYAVAVESDHSVVVVGTVMDAGTAEQAVVKLTPTGALDPAFASGAGYENAYPSGGSISTGGSAVALGAGGAIVAAGDADSNDDLYVTKLTATGATDSTFGPAHDGTLDTPVVSDSSFHPQTVSVAASGDIVVVGTGTDGGGNQAVIVIRLLADGTPDPAFGTAGIADFEIADGYPSVASGALAPNGDILLGVSDIDTGLGLSEVDVMRLTPDGQLDTSFGTAGSEIERITAGSDTVSAVAANAFGKIDVFGTTGDAPSQDFALQLLRDGRPDPSFGTDGIASGMVGGAGASTAAAGVIQPDGNIVEFGSYASGIDVFGGLRFLGTPLVDTDGPSAPRISTDGDTADWLAAATVHAAITSGSVDSDSGVAGYSWSWDDDPSGVPGPLIDGDWTTTMLPSHPLPAGENYFHIVARDYAGNASSVVTLGPFRVDGDAPHFTMNAVYGDTSIAFTVHATDAESGLAPQPYSFDGGATWTSDPNYTLTGIPYGQVGAVAIEVRDMAGNIASDTGYGLTLDTVPPTITPTGGLLHFASASSPRGAGFTIADLGSGLSAVTATFRGHAVHVVNGAVPYAELPEGRGTLKIVAQDMAGNTTRFSHQLTVDRTAPAITSAARFVLGGAAQVRITDAVSGVRVSRATIRLPKLGANRVSVHAADRAGNARTAMLTVTRRISLANPKLNRGLRVHVSMGSFSVDESTIDSVFTFVGPTAGWYEQAARPSPLLVGEVQWRLQMLGFLSHNARRSGRLDGGTIRAIERYQRSRHIPGIGTVGPRTRTALDADLARIR